MGVLELKDVTLDLGGKPILNGLSVDFWEGHVHALVGPNGAGKSTLAGAIMGLPDYRHLRGEILLDGEPIQDLPVDERARRGITLAWQEPARFEGLRVDRFILAGAKDRSRETVERVLAPRRPRSGQVRDARRGQDALRRRAQEGRARQHPRHAAAGCAHGRA